MRFGLGGGIICPIEINRKAEEKPMKKIQMSTPLVEMDGDEMTLILWQQIK